MAELIDIGPFYRGEDEAPIFTMAPLTDITGWTISFRLKASLLDATVLLTIGAILTAPSSGIYTVPITAAQTAALPAGNYAYDIWRTDSGSAAPLNLGQCVIKGSVRIP